MRIKWLFIREQPFGTSEKDTRAVLKKTARYNDKMTKLSIYYYYIFLK